MAQGTLIGIARHQHSRAPMEELERATISYEAGVGGDFRGARTIGRDGHRQVTLVDRAAWQAACADLGQDIPWTARRANLLIDGIDLNETTGAEVRIGEVVLEITGETDPCRRMDEAHRGLKEALTPDWRGGAMCRVIAGGEIRVGDRVELAAGNGGV